MVGFTAFVRECTWLVGGRRDGKTSNGLLGREGWMEVEPAATNTPCYIKDAPCLRNPAAESDLRDSMGWMANGGKFSVSSAYKLACGWFEESHWRGWKLMWKIKVP